MRTSQPLALPLSAWETIRMSDTRQVIVGEKGRLVIPASIREQFGWETGTELLIVQTDWGIELCTRDALINRLRGSMKGSLSVDEFIAEKRAEARREDELLGM